MGTNLPQPSVGVDCDFLAGLRLAGRVPASSRRAGGFRAEVTAVAAAKVNANINMRS